MATHEANDKDDEDDEEEPRVVLAKLSAVAKWMPEATAKMYANRPIWFILGMDAELVTVFERLPEDPMPKGHVAAILQGLRAFATERNDALQAVLGVTDSIELGFHVDATYAKVVDSFEQDGFLVVATIEAGELQVLASEEDG